MNTNLDAVFELILQRALKANISQDQMIKTLFIFSDMQFDDCCGASSGRFGPMEKETNFQAAQAKFKKHGHQLPKVVFWNLRGQGLGETASAPLTHREEGTALVSGFSGQLLKLFMGGVDELETFDPFNIMKEAIGKEKYDGWKVVD